MKKLTMFKGAALLAAVAVLTTAVSAAVFADSTFTDSNGIVSVVEGNTISVRKDIVVTNTDTSVTKVYGPDITYSYTIEPVTIVHPESTKVTDSSNNFLFVKSGVEQSVSLTDYEAVFTSHEVALTGGKATISDTITVSVDPAKFTAPGIYRYAITEDNSAAFTPKLAQQAMSRDITNYKNVRYLDVYIKNGASGFEVNGYVLFAAASGQAIIDGTEGHSGTSSGFIGKTEGFVDSVNIESAGGTWSGEGTLADRYNTYNLQINKEITGDLADKTHQFPFTLSMETANITGRQFTYSVQSGGVAGEAQTGIIGGDITAGLGHNDSMSVYGLPATVKFNVKEKNDTVDEYKTTITDTIKKTIKNSVSVSTDTFIYAFGESGTTKQGLTNYSTINDAITQAYADMTFENSLSAVSPTGVILRSMPYAIIFSGAIILVVLCIRGKKKNTTEEIL